MTLGGRIDEIDVQIEKISRLILGASKNDPELAAGLGCGEDLGNVQRKIDKAGASCEVLDSHVRDLVRGR
jgi:hypothetical protein